MAAGSTAHDVPTLDPASRRVGTLLDGKWTLDRLLGVGGMAAVYAATHRNGARAAIKLFPFSVTTSAEFAERILREGYLANKIGHPAVVRVTDDHLDREREYAYLVMELLEGETARQRVERLGPMSPLEAIEFTIELADCLRAAHEKGVVHRDIKPENLFLTHEDALKVLDFGVARAMDGSSSFATRTGAALGTPAYMSPEQARGKPSEISARSDLYAAGATLLFLVAGEFLHEGESAQEIMVRAAWTPARKMADRDLGLPEPLAAIIDKACEFDPDDRFQSAAELEAALEAARHVLLRNPDAASPIPRRTPRPPSPAHAAAMTMPALPRIGRNGEATMTENTPPPLEPGGDGPVARLRRRPGFVAGVVVALIAVAALAVATRSRTAEVAAGAPAASARAEPTPPPRSRELDEPAAAPTAVPVAAAAPASEPSAPPAGKAKTKAKPGARPVVSAARALVPPGSAPPQPEASHLAPVPQAQKPPRSPPPVTGRDVGY